MRVGEVFGKLGSRWGTLVCLFFAMFAIGTDDFVIAGVLPEISDGLSVSEAAAGQLITVFSITYALGAPVMAVFTSRFPRRAVLIFGVILFAATNFVAAAAPSYTILMFFRVLTALAAASITPAAFAAAVEMAPPERKGRYIGTVAAGLTLALVAGVPLGTLLGAAFGWRSTFLFVAAMSCVVALGMSLFLPRLPASRPSPLRRRLSLLTRRPILVGVLGTVVGASGGLMTFTYIAPIARDLSGVGPERLAVLIAVAGIFGILGTSAGGRAADAWGSGRALLAALAGQVAATLTLAGFALMGGGSWPLLAVGAAFAGWGFAGWAYNPPMNMRVLGLAGDAATEAVALNTSGLYLGIAIGGAVGGAVLSGFGVPGVLIAASALGVLTLVMLAFSVRLHPAPGEESK